MSNVRSFIILHSGEGLTSVNKNERVNLSGGKGTTKLPGVSFFENSRKNFSSNLVPEVVFALESKVCINRHYYNSAFSPWSQRSGLTPKGLIPIVFWAAGQQRRSGGRKNLSYFKQGNGVCICTGSIVLLSNMSTFAFYFR